MGNVSIFRLTNLSLLYSMIFSCSISLFYDIYDSKTIVKVGHQNGVSPIRSFRLLNYKVAKICTSLMGYDHLAEATIGNKQESKFLMLTFVKNL